MRGTITISDFVKKLIIHHLRLYRILSKSAISELPLGLIGAELRLYILWTNGRVCAMMDFREKTCTGGLRYAE